MKNSVLYLIESKLNINIKGHNIERFIKRLKNNNIEILNIIYVSKDEINIKTYQIEGAKVMLSINGKEYEYAPPIDAGSITNVATISGGGIADITATETVNASSAPLLNIAKAISPSTITENDPLTYTFVIQNTGNTEATNQLKD